MFNARVQVLTANETVVWIPRIDQISEDSACLGESLRKARSGCGSPWGHRHWWQPFPGAAPTTCTLVWADTTKEFSHLDIPDSHHQLKRNKTIEKIFIINHEANRIKTFLISRNKVKHCPLNLSSLTSMYQIRSDQSLSCVRLFATPWIAARQASLSITNSRSSLRLTSTESVMPSSHLILCL